MVQPVSSSGFYWVFAGFCGFFNIGFCKRFKPDLFWVIGFTGSTADPDRFQNNAYHSHMTKRQCFAWIEMLFSGCGPTKARGLRGPTFKIQRLLLFLTRHRFREKINPQIISPSANGERFRQQSYSKKNSGEDAATGAAAAAIPAAHILHLLLK